MRGFRQASACIWRVQVFVNGVWVGVNRDPARLVKTLRELRRNMDVNTEARDQLRTL